MFETPQLNFCYQTIFFKLLIARTQHSRATEEHRCPLNLTFPMLRLLSSKPQGGKEFLKSSKPCHVGIHWIALAEYSQMSTHVPGFQLFFHFLHPYVLAKFAPSSISVLCRSCFMHITCVSSGIVLVRLRWRVWVKSVSVLFHAYNLCVFRYRIGPFEVESVG